jgi:hypothetical protein
MDGRVLWPLTALFRTTRMQPSTRPTSARGVPNHIVVEFTAR